jgi:hypothetical protein
MQPKGNLRFSKIVQMGLGDLISKGVIKYLRTVKKCFLPPPPPTSAQMGKTVPQKGELTKNI